MNEELLDPTTLAALYAEAVSPDELDDEQWDREQRLLDTDD